MKWPWPRDNILQTKIQISKKTKKHSQNYKIEQISNTSSILARYRDKIENEIKNKLTHNIINSDETTDILNRIINETATNAIGFKRKKTKLWITEDILSNFVKNVDHWILKKVIIWKNIMHCIKG